MQIGTGKQGVKFGEYPADEQLDLANDGNGVIGWVQPLCDKPEWIVWFTKRGDLILYTEREPTGAVIGEPITVKATR